MGKQPHTSLQCLAAVARNCGVDLSTDRLQHDYAIGAETPSPRLLLRIAKDAGLRAKRARISWDALQKLRDAYPLIAELDNGNYVIIAGATGSDHEGEQLVRVFDPLAERPEPLMLTREQFQRQWTGEVMFVKRHYALSDTEQPF